ncbi:MAG TPA: hypothetical protein VMW58_04575 [Anaerolineae bacterium]|nr:hypothetical protein [Anaerolineae bacterium]
MREQILQYIREMGGGVSFAELERELGESVRGDLSLCIGEAIILWPNVSQDFADAFDDLIDSRSIEMRPTSFLVYLVDGKTLSLPLARGNYKYRKLHWLPICLYPKAEQA